MTFWPSPRTLAHRGSHQPLVRAVEVGDGRLPLNSAPERVARTEAQVIEAARALFLEHGYVATTLVQVGQRARVAERSAHVRFKIKAACSQGRRPVSRQRCRTYRCHAPTQRPAGDDGGHAAQADRSDGLQSVGITERAGALFDVAAQAEGTEPEDPGRPWTWSQHRVSRGRFTMVGTSDQRVPQVHHLPTGHLGRTWSSIWYANGATSGWYGSPSGRATEVFMAAAAAPRLTLPCGHE
jgi:hypothetical protein